MQREDNAKQSLEMCCLTECLGPIETAASQGLCYYLDVTADHRMHSYSAMHTAIIH